MADAASPALDPASLDLEALRALCRAHKTELDSHKSEIELRLEELEAALEPVQRKPARRGLPPRPPRETVVQEPAEESCPDCGGAMRPLGEDVSETLEYEPARFKMIRRVRPKLSCGGCDRIVQAPAASRGIERGLAGPGLLAHVLTAKCGQHLPLYRQAESYGHAGMK